MKAILTMTLALAGAGTMGCERTGPTDAKATRASEPAEPGGQSNAQARASADPAYGVTAPGGGEGLLGAPAARGDAKDAGHVATCSSDEVRIQQGGDAVCARSCRSDADCADGRTCSGQGVGAANGLYCVFRTR